MTVLTFGQISVISRKRYKIETYFQGKTNRKSYMWPIEWHAPVLVTLNNLEGRFPVAGLFIVSSAIRRTFVQYFTRFQLTPRSRGPSATAGLLVFIDEVAQGYYTRRIIVTPFVNQQFSCGTRSTSSLR